MFNQLGMDISVSASSFEKQSNCKETSLLNEGVTHASSSGQVLDQENMNFFKNNDFFL